MYKLYSRISDHETVLELWGASTKHPDSVFYFSDFKIGMNIIILHQLAEISYKYISSSGIIGKCTICIIIDIRTSKTNYPLDF